MGKINLLPKTKEAIINFVDDWTDGKYDTDWKDKMKKFEAIDSRTLDSYIKLARGNMLNQDVFLTHVFMKYDYDKMEINNIDLFDAVNKSNTVTDNVSFKKLSDPNELNKYIDAVIQALYKDIDKNEYSLLTPQKVSYLEACFRSIMRIVRMFKQTIDIDYVLKDMLSYTINTSDEWSADGSYRAIQRLLRMLGITTYNLSYKDDEYELSKLMRFLTNLEKLITDYKNTAVEFKIQEEVFLNTCYNNKHQVLQTMCSLGYYNQKEIIDIHASLIENIDSKLPANIRICHYNAYHEDRSKYKYTDVTKIKQELMVGLEDYPNGLYMLIHGKVPEKLIDPPRLNSESTIGIEEEMVKIFKEIEQSDKK